jgi:hypothetical protein
MWRHVDIVLSDISEEGIASIFKVEEKKKKKSVSSHFAPAHVGFFLFFYPED